MENREELYKNLENLYSGKDGRYDSVSRGYEIEKLVKLLMNDIVSPLKHKLNVRIGKNEFDGEVIIGKRKLILYDIFVGNLSRFRYERFSYLVRTAYFPRKTYFLIIARSFSKQDKERIQELTERIATKKVKLCFIDYKVLISLHRFSSKMKVEHVEKYLKTVKSLFLEKLFESDSITHESLFDSALSYALDLNRLQTRHARETGLVHADGFQFEIFQDAAGEYRFKLRAPNGEIIAVSEGYVTKVACKNGIEAVRKGANMATIQDRTIV